MKKCPYCGVGYPDEAVVCAIDKAPLEWNNPTPLPTPAEPGASEEVQPAPSGEAPKVDDPEYFRCLWRVDSVDTGRLLKQFVDADIRFRIQQIEVHEPRRSELVAAGYPLTKKFDVYVHLDDRDKAMKILAADWKV